MQHLNTFILSMVTEKSEKLNTNKIWLMLSSGTWWGGSMYIVYLVTAVVVIILFIVVGVTSLLWSS